jgi:hypothetical protein
MGVVVGFALTSSSSSSDSNTVAVDDPSVVTLYTAIGSSTYTLVGKRSGQTILHATAGGASETTMTVLVTEQAAQP